MGRSLRTLVVGLSAFLLVYWSLDILLGAVATPFPAPLNTVPKLGAVLVAFLAAVLAWRGQGVEI